MTRDVVVLEPGEPNPFQRLQRGSWLPRLFIQEPREVVAQAHAVFGVQFVVPLLQPGQEVGKTGEE